MAAVVVQGGGAGGTRRMCASELLDWVGGSDTVSPVLKVYAGATDYFQRFPLLVEHFLFEVARYLATVR